MATLQGRFLRAAQTEESRAGARRTRMTGPADTDDLRRSPLGAPRSCAAYAVAHKKGHPFRFTPGRAVGGKKPNRCIKKTAETGGFYL